VSVVIGGGVAALARFGLGLKGLLGVLPFILLPVLLIIIVSVLVLIFRQLLIFLLVILSPIAFVAWILPGTDKYFKAWWDLFIKALVMYPLIVAFIASGELIAKILVAGDESNGLMQLIGIVALFAPYFLIPQTFKFAGSIISNVTSFVQQRGKDYNNRLLGDIRDPFSYRGRRRAQ